MGNAGYFSNDDEDDDDDDDGDENDELFFVESWTTKDVYALFSDRTIVRDFHHRKSLIRCKQYLNLRRIWVETLSNEFVQ